MRMLYGVMVGTVLLVTVCVGQQNPAPAKNNPAHEDSSLKTQKDRISYAIGMNVGANLHRQSVDVDLSVLLQGLKDALGGSKLLMTDDEARQTIMAFQSEKMKLVAETNKKEGDAYLAANKGKEGVVTLPSGLQYKI